MTRRGMLVVGGVALGARVAYTVAFMRHYTPNSDADSYYHIALAVSRGQGFGFTLPFDYVHATAIRPPLSPTMFAFAMSVFGRHVGVAQAVNIVAGSLAAVFAGVVGARIAGSRAGLYAGLAVALYIPLIANDVTTLVESFAVLLFLAVVLFLVDGRTVLAGAALGLTMLDRASAQWLVVVFGAWVVWRFGWWHALRFAAVAFLVVAPWLVRNWVHVGGPVIVATNGYNLNAKYSSEANADNAFADAYFDPRFDVVRTDAVDEVDLDARLRRHAMHDLRERPSRIVHVLRANTLSWFELRPSWNRDAERLDGRSLTVRDWTWPLFFPVTILGAFGLVRGRRSAAAQLLMLGAAYFTVVCIVSIAVPRLRSVFDVCAAIGAGVGIAVLLDRQLQPDSDRPPRRAIRVVPSVATIGAAALLIGVAGYGWRQVTEHHARQSLATTLRNDAPAVDAVARAVAAGGASGEPPRIASTDNDHLENLVRVLGVRAPETTPGLRARVAAALREARRVSRESNAVALLSASEYLHPSTVGPSLDRVRTRYETEVRPGQPALDSWDAIVSGAPMRELDARLSELRAALGLHQ